MVMPSSAAVVDYRPLLDLVLINKVHVEATKNAEAEADDKKTDGEEKGRGQESRWRGEAGR